MEDANGLSEDVFATNPLSEAKVGKADEVSILPSPVGNMWHNTIVGVIAVAIRETTKHDMFQ